jgi:photosynthetic reaction center H subunit
MEPVGVITEGIDWALVVLYAFWLFFAGLVFYLRREDRREGYPLVDDVTGRQERASPIWLPDPKTFVTETGAVYKAPRVGHVEPPVENAVPASPFPGAPLVPVGNKLLSGVGPASYAMRADRPDVNAENEIKIVPMRRLPTHSIAAEDADPRGFEVVGADGLPAGVVEDLWVDRSEMLVRYIEVRLDPSIARQATAEARTTETVEAAAIAEDERTGDVAVAVVTETETAAPVQNVLLPMTVATLAPTYGQISTNTILASQFADVPRTKDPEQVTLLEEDKIVGYFVGGNLYATPSREEPLL